MRRYKVFIGVLVVALVATGVVIVMTVGANSKRTEELCVFVDTEHNRERANIVRTERELYTKFAKSFAIFTDTVEKRQEIHANSRRSYYEVRKTRPDYCAKVRKNPVKPYPSLDEIRP